MSNNLFRQQRVRFLGELVDAVFTALPALSIYSGLSVTVILYEAVKSYIQNWLPWMNVFYFLAGLLVGFTPVVLLTYKYVIPSIWHFRSTQMSHLEAKVDAQSAQLRELKRLLEEERANRRSE